MGEILVDEGGAILLKGAHPLFIGLFKSDDLVRGRAFSGCCPNSFCDALDAPVLSRSRVLCKTIKGADISEKSLSV